MLRHEPYQKTMYDTTFLVTEMGSDKIILVKIQI